MDNIQGKDAILYFEKEGYIPFACATEITIGIDTEDMPVRTIGDGNYKKSRYQTTGYNITLGGVIAFDDQKETSWDLLDNQLGYVHLNYRCTFTSSTGKIKSIQGQVKVTNSQISIRPGSIVTSNFTLTGNGKIFLFDGAVPCDGVVTNILFADLDNSDNQIAIAYEYNGSPIRMNWYLDEFSILFPPRTGFVEVPSTIFINDIDTGSHTIRLEPICNSDFVGQDMGADFVVTAGEACNVAISTHSHSISGQTIGFNFTTTGGTPPNNYVRIYRNNTLVFQGLYDSTITFNSIPYGDSTWKYEFYCENGLLGDSLTEVINIPGGATLKISYKEDVPEAGETITMITKKGGGILHFMAVPQDTIDGIAISDVIHTDVSGTVARRLIVSDDTPTVLYDNTGTSLSFTIPSIISGKTYFITLQHP